MSIENKEWLDAAWDNFKESLTAGDIGMAKAIIADTQEAGYLEEGRKMSATLQFTDITKNKIIEVISLLKEKKGKYETEGFVPTIEMLIEDLEQELYKTKR